MTAVETVFDQPPLNRLPRFPDLAAYFASSIERSDEWISAHGVWNSGPLQYSLFRAKTPGEVIAAQEGASGPVILLSRGCPEAALCQAIESAVDQAMRATPANVNNLDWLLSWEKVGRGMSISGRAQIDRPELLLYG